MSFWVLIIKRMLAKGFTAPKTKKSPIILKRGFDIKLQKKANADKRLSHIPKLVISPL
jgi:hypothetical protein